MNSCPTNSNSYEEFAQESSSNKVQSCLDRLHQKYTANTKANTQQKSQYTLPQLSLAGFRLPSYLEDLGIFCVSSPGSGKTRRDRNRSPSGYRIA